MADNGASHPSGMVSGLQLGNRQGVLSGNANNNIKSGLIQGLKENITNKDKIQFPETLPVKKMPWFYINADKNVEFDLSQYTLVLDSLNVRQKFFKAGIITNVDAHPTVDVSLNIGYGIKTYPIMFASNGSASGNRPYLKDGEAFGLNNHKILDFGGINGTNTNPFLCTWDRATPGAFSTAMLGGVSGGITTDSITIMGVMKRKDVVDKSHFYLDGVLISGGFDIRNSNPYTSFDFNFYGNDNGSGNTRTSGKRTRLNDLNDWFIFTMKATLKQKKGTGSETECFINGRKLTFQSTNNWTTPEIIQTFQNKQLVIGGTNTLSANGNSMYLAQMLLFPYWLNESEQLRIENYFRYYYGRKF